MDITELKDKTVIELTEAVTQPHSPRSKKPAPEWKAGTRFIVYHRVLDRRTMDRNWELERVGNLYGQRGRGGLRTISLLMDAETFLRVIRHANPVDDVRAVFSTARFADAKDTLDFMVRTGVLDIDQVKAAVLGYEAESDAIDAEKDAERMAEAAEEEPKPGEVAVSK